MSATAMGPKGTAIRLAIVDDEPNILSALRRELRAQEYQLTEFNDPVQALEAISNEDFAVVLSDNMMPNLTGLELMARVQTVRPGTRRILLTGRTDLNQAVAAFNSGTIHAFLHKPWNREQLVETIQKEIGVYREQRDADSKRVQLEAQNQLRGARLIQTIKELKQTKTQLLLIEDSGKVEQPEVSPRLRRASILVVDEFESVRKLLVDAFKRAGIARCDGVPNAHAALERIRDGLAVDVIVSEWSLEGMDGIAFMHAVRQSTSPAAKAAFFLMATHEQKSIVEFALKSGINGYLIKPFHLANLIGQIERCWVGAAESLGELSDIAAKTVLVVNSHPSSRDQIEQHLTSTGFTKVISATFGPAALDRMRQFKPELVVYDVNVKDPDWKHLRSKLLLEAHPPVLLITAVFPVEDELERLREANVAHYLPGPFRQPELLEAVRASWHSAKNP